MIRKYLNTKALLLVVLIFSFISCEDKDVTYEYTAIPKTEIGAKLVNGTDLIAQIKSDSSYTVIPGVTANEIAYLSMTGLAMKLFIFEIDLTHPNVSVEVSTPNNKPAFSTQQMTKQAEFEDSENHKVWGGINGDFFSTTGTPQGILYKDGVAIKTTFTDAVCTYFAITHDKKALIAGQEDYPTLRSSFKEAVGGRVRLVDHGVLSIQTDDRVEPRTCIGVSEDGNKVWMMAVDGRNFWYSNGMKYTELGQCMVALGAYNAINLDGGGSTTFFLRNTPNFTDGRFEVRNWPFDRGGAERAVANGLLIIGK
jgi:exopolysaccharide biosynthesis protein